MQIIRNQVDLRILTELKINTMIHSQHTVDAPTQLGDQLQKCIQHSLNQAFIPQSCRITNLL